MLFKKAASKTFKYERLMAEQYGASKASFYVYTVLRLIVIAIIVLDIVRGHYEHLWQAILTLIFFSMPPFYERTLKADLPTAFEIVVLFFAFSANILGEIFSFYIKFAHWDTMLHTTYGFIFAALGFSLIDLFSKDENTKFEIHPIYFVINSLGFTMFVGVLWECFEFFADNVLGKDMQKDTIVDGFQTVTLDETNTNIPIVVDNIKSTIINFADGTSLTINGYLDIGIYDTMIDLIVALIGAVVFCCFLVPYLKTKGNNKIAAMFIPVKRNWKEKPSVVEADLAKVIVDIEKKISTEEKPPEEK